MSRKRRSKRSGKNGARQRKQQEPSIPVTRDWSRAGAHNIAGVSFQVAVTARLLLDARSGKLPISRVTPEGLEDIDLDCLDETRILVQVKERSPTVRFTPSDLVSALSKKSVALAEAPSLHFVLATDATLGRGLSSTGWEEPLSGCLPKENIDGLAVQLGAYFDEPYEILGRTHVVQFERSVIENSRHDFAQIMEIHPSVAYLAYARLIERITEISVQQRWATPDTATWISPSDLEALTKQVLETVDIDSLDEAVRTGIIDPVDFSRMTDLSVDDFLRGVDVLPIHIAADLDIPRPAELQALADALQDSNSTLITGPSGAGKSALVWRTARELAGRVRPYRLLRLLPEDIATISRWIRLQEPSENFPLLLCADNLGRAQNEGWTALAREFIDIPGVLLLGACREEDFRPELVVGRTTLVVPELDHELAVSVGKELAGRQIQTALDVSEAFENSEGLLMEFLSMLLTGRRLCQVVEQQMADRLAEDRRTERDIVRLISTAHSAGVSLPAETLEDLMPGRDLAPALAVLKKEHILDTDNASRWRGFHELRSTIARDYLHQFPPPTISMTIRQLVEHLPIIDACRIIEFYAQQNADLKPAADAVAEILSTGFIRAKDATQLVGSLAMTDAIRHARECLSVVEEKRPSGLDPETTLSMAYAHRFAGVSFDSLKEVNPNFAHLIRIADSLPPPQESLRNMSLQKLSPEKVREVALRGTPEEAVTWLESLEGSPAAGVVPIEELIIDFRKASLNVVAPLLGTLNALNPDVAARMTIKFFSYLPDRVRWIANDLSDCVGADTKDDVDGKVVTVRLLVPENNDNLNDRSVQTCRMALDMCTEADFAETIVLTPEGNRYSLDDAEPGYKRIARENLPRQPLTTPNRNFMRAARLLLASRYWTDYIRLLAEISEKLLEMRNESVGWLVNPHHNNGRRRKTVNMINKLMVQLSSGPKEPAIDESTDDRSGATNALNDALLVVRDIAASESPDDLEKRRLGTRCRSAVKALSEARQRNLPTLSSVGNPLPESLDEMLALLADVLLAQAESLKSVSGSPRRHGTETWVDAARRFVGAALSGGYQEEMKALEEALGESTRHCEINRIEHRDLKSPKLLADWWVIQVPVESDDSVLLSFAERMDETMAERLAFRVFVVFVADGYALPLHTIKLGLSRFWPADNDLSTIASGLELNILESTHLKMSNSFVAKLLSASREGALLRIRRKEGLSADRSAFGARFESAREAAKELHPLVQREGNRLLSRVELEPEKGSNTLAGELYRSITHGEQSADLAAINTLNIAALSVDLS